MPRGTAPAVALLVGVVTPLMQVAQLCDAVAAWWVSQETQETRRLPLRPAPLDVVVEGLVFVLTALYLRMALILGHVGPEAEPFFFSLEARLVVCVATSLATVTAGLAKWDGTVSLKLSQDMYGWPGRRTSRGIRTWGLLLAHLAFRASEVAGKSALLAALAALLGLRFLSGYLLITYAAGIAVLILSSPNEARVGHLFAAAVLAWPLLFANLPQFVDSPQHAVAAQNAACLVCGLRAIELAMVLSAATASFLLEEEATAIQSPAGPLAGVTTEWRTLYQRRATLGWAMEEKDFWPPALGLAHLLLVAACERAPPVWSLVAAAGGSGLAPSGADRQLRMEDFETLGLIGQGEFGKVFQVRLRATQEIFAMKLLSKEFYLRRRMADTAIRETAMLHFARDHPFVVKLVHTFENVRDWVMVMEYCPNGDLQQLLVNEGSPGLTLSRTLKISSEAERAGGVYAAFTKTFCGSFGYAAPEVNPRREVHGFAADMYSFGVLLLMLLMGGEVYHNSREAPYERRLPPETASDLRAVVSSLAFDFYWASHRLLQPTRASHRLEVNLHGNTVLFSRAPRGVRRQARPQRPPNSPRVGRRGPDAAMPSSRAPARFPDSALESSEAERRQWERALDLVRLLTHELPEQRGTVAGVKHHAFFAEEILDWRTVYPRSWLIERLKKSLLTLYDGGPLPSYMKQRLEQLSVEELITLQDDPARSVELLDPDLKTTGLSPRGPPPPGPLFAGAAVEGDSAMREGAPGYL
ncbi:unnamed protein product [Prorocentrum cordatum]|uniref:non-specific serine/threonine protein kinase n=1 Tax=Prorocentrum cordatum TaxID=2364126 RepID=A0ABN9T817_9DINO|nr:unnamed protein product [Polarella glacialis]